MTVSTISKKPQVDQASNRQGQTGQADIANEKANLQKEFQELITQQQNVRESNDTSNTSNNGDSNNATNEKGDEDERKASLQTRSDLVKVQIQYIQNMENQSQANNQNSAENRNKKVEV